MFLKRAKIGATFATLYTKGHNICMYFITPFAWLPKQISVGVNQSITRLLVIVGSLGIGIDEGHTEKYKELMGTGRAFRKIKENMLSSLHSLDEPWLLSFYLFNPITNEET